MSLESQVPSRSFEFSTVGDGGSILQVDSHSFDNRCLLLLALPHRAAPAEAVAVTVTAGPPSPFIPTSCEQFHTPFFSWHAASSHSWIFCCADTVGRIKVSMQKMPIARLRLRTNKRILIKWSSFLLSSSRTTKGRKLPGMSFFVLESCS